MPSYRCIIYAITDKDEVILGKNDYDYVNDETVMSFIRKYKKVVLDDNFDSSIDFLPSEVTHLTLGIRFNKPIENLPSNLKYLCFEKDGYYKTNTYFDYPIDNLPQGLEELIINIGKNNKTTKLGSNLPSSLKRLSMKYENKINLDFNNLPDNLEYIYADSYEFNFDELEKLPKNLKIIEGGITKYRYQTNERNNIAKRFKCKFPNVEFNYILD